MKKGVALFVVLFFLISPMVISVDAVAQQASPKVQQKATDIFQHVADTIAASGHPSEPQQTDKVEGFQQQSDRIAGWDVYSAAAKKLSLRDNKKELIMRKGMPPGVPIE